MKRKYKPEGYKCPYCPAIFSTPQSLGGHVTAKHTEANLDLILARKGYVKKEKTAHENRTVEQG